MNVNHIGMFLQAYFVIFVVFEIGWIVEFCESSALFQSVLVGYYSNNILLDIIRMISGSESYHY